MNKYQTQAKIYAIRSHQTDAVYIGGTLDTLPKRLFGQKQEYVRYLQGKHPYTTNCDLLKYDDHYIELIENYPCNDRNELNKRIGQLIRDTEKCVNKKIGGRTTTEYQIDNVEKFNQTHECECGGKYKIKYKARHEKSKKHQKYLEA